ncbi:MAG: hypothetical protein H0T56_03050 [Pseudaminobacter sp.]|nr:hypothetical protein [Pseudaminobacter sp.]
MAPFVIGGLVKDAPDPSRDPADARRLGWERNRKRKVDIAEHAAMDPACSRLRVLRRASFTDGDFPRSQLGVTTMIWRMFEWSRLAPGPIGRHSEIPLETTRKVSAGIETMSFEGIR